MIRRLYLAAAAALFFLLIPAFFHLYNYSQNITITPTASNVAYELPYPGLLPDHPLYFLKAIRDKALDIMTREPKKKAQLYLQLSDKRINAAYLLTKKGKGQLAISTASKAEKYALKIPAILIQAKKEGIISPDHPFVERLKRSNAKHALILKEILKLLPQGNQEEVGKVMKLNQETRTDLQKL